MRAVGLDFERRTPDLLDVPEPPPPGPGEVRLKIHEVGVCATDRELARFRFGVPPPSESSLILGHEALAVVESAGAGVAGFQTGDWVVPMVRRACAPLCPSCRAGRFDLCATGLYLERGINRLHGYFTSFALDDPAHLIPVPADLIDVAALAEPLSVVEKAIETALRAHPLQPSRAAITGAGPIGILLALALQVRGFDVHVVSQEPEDHPRARLLRDSGIAYLRAAAPPPCDLVFEASGAPAAALAALDWLATAGVFVFVGAPPSDIPVPGMRMIVSNLTFAGVVNAARIHFDAALADLRRIERRRLDALIERRHFRAWADSLSAPSVAPKLIHRID